MVDTGGFEPPAFFKPDALPTELSALKAGGESPFSILSSLSGWTQQVIQSVQYIFEQQMEVLDIRVPLHCLGNPQPFYQGM